MLKQIGLLEGEGELHLRSLGARSPANYSIAVWGGPDGITFGKGYISGAVPAIYAAALVRGSIPLRLSAGGEVELVVTGRGAGKPWAEVYVSNVPLNRVVPLAA